MAIKLFYSPIHGFIHKVLVVAHEAGVWDQLEFVPVYPISDGYSIAAINPLHKVPTIALEDGTVLYGSQTCVEYLDSLSTSGHRLYPSEGSARWDALRRLALADTLFEVTVVMTLEKLEPSPREVVFKWNWAKVVRAVDQMEEDAANGFDTFDVGQASALHGLSYLDRQTTKGLMPPVPDSWNWRNGRPALTKWWDAAIERPSVTSHFNVEYEGDDSAEFCQTKVAEVLRAQGRPAPDKPVPVPVDFVPITD